MIKYNKAREMIDMIKKKINKTETPEEIIKRKKRIEEAKKGKYKFKSDYHQAMYELLTF